MRSDKRSADLKARLHTAALARTTAFMNRHPYRVERMNFDDVYRCFLGDAKANWNANHAYKA
jgi:hypothetical protein